MRRDIRTAAWRAWRNGPVYPKWLQIEHTNRCNLKCVMCAHGYGEAPERRDVDFDDFVAMLDEFRGPNASPALRSLEMVELQGLGEPFLHKQMLPMLREARARGLDVFFVSNFTVLTDEMARELVALGNSFIIVSVDSVDSQAFADIRRGAKFDVRERVLGNLARLQRVKQELGVLKPRVVVNSILMKQTLHQIPELVETLRGLGVSKISFTDLIPYAMDAGLHFANGEVCKEQSLIDMPHDEKRALLAKIKQLSTPECEVEVPDDHGGENFGRRDIVLTCTDLWEKPYVCSDGTVTPCCYLSDPATAPMGNLHEQSFEQIWFGRPYDQLRRSHLGGNPPHFCAQCPRLVTPVAGRPGDTEGAVYDRIFLGDRPYSLTSRPRPGVPTLAPRPAADAPAQDAREHPKPAA